jgi:hypothetical protein
MSVTVAVSTFAKGVFTVAVCPLPVVAETMAGTPGPSREIVALAVFDGSATLVAITVTVCWPDIEVGAV